MPETGTHPRATPAVAGVEAGAITGAIAGAEAPAVDGASSRSPIDRLVRQLLLIGDASPRALFDLRGSMLIAGVRCTLTYAIIPFGAPLVGWLGILATPFSLALSLVAIGLAISSLRRVWMADYRHRWPYTAFIVIAVVLLVVVVIGDVRTLRA
jgi:hypothetical protein